MTGRNERTKITAVKHESTRVILCESRRMVGEALGEALAKSEGIECLGVAKSYFAARRALSAVAADVILVGLDFHEAEVRALLGECRMGRVVFLANSVTAQMLSLQASYPSFTVVSSQAPLSELVRNLRGEPSQDLLGEDLPPDCLSGREYETLQLLVEGLNPTEIGEHLYLSIHTVRFHIKSLLSKLGVSSQAAAIVAGIERGLVSPPARDAHVGEELLPA